MAVDKSLVSGSMTMLILKLLEDGELYGYEMIELLRERSNDVFELKAGTLYPLLHSLVKQKCLKSYEKEVNGKVRKYYSLTPLGQKKLEEKEEEWRTYSNAVISVMAGV